MDNAILNDVIALIVAVMGIFVAVLEGEEFMHRKGCEYRWIPFVKMLIGIYTMALMVYVVANTDPVLDGRIPIIPGRVLLIFLIAGMSFSSLLQRRRGCK